MIELDEQPKLRRSLLKAMNEKYYYDFQWQQTEGKEHPYIAEKAKVILDVIPQDVRTIIDVGCGDWTITNVLAKEYKVVGGDLSQEGLKHLSANASPVVSNAACLPFKDNCADMIFSSELLEHLPDEVFLKAISEMKRISSLSCIFIAISGLST